MNKLTPARFAALAEAYGGDIARWPEEERTAAFLLAADPTMQALLADAGRLDAELEAWRVAPPSADLRTRVVRSWPRPLSRRAKLWWSGIGIATALAGAAAGTVAAAAVAPADHGTEPATAFGDLAGQEV
jgi:hypothetical protein